VNTLHCWNSWDTGARYHLSYAHHIHISCLRSFYFPGVLVGPYLEYADYHDVVHETVFKQQKLKGHSGRNIPDGRKRVGYRKMIMGLIYLGVFVLFGGKYNYSCLIAPWFMQKPLLHR